MDDINDTIFNIVKSNLTDDVNPETFLKICSGSATEEEKEKCGLSEEIIEKLKNSCDVGYNMASNLDKERNEVSELKLVVSELKLEVSELKLEFEELKKENIEMKEQIEILKKLVLPEKKELHINYEEVQYM